MARLRGSKWQADVKLSDGSRARPTFNSEVEAEAWEGAARLAVAQGKPVPTGAVLTSTTSKLDNLGALYDYVVRTHWSNLASGDHLAANARCARDYFGSNKSVSSIGAVDIAEYRYSLGEGGNAPATVNRKTAALSKMLKTALEAGVIKAMPIIKWGKEEKTKFRYLDHAEEDVLLSYWSLLEDKDLHDLCATLIDTGGRCFKEVLPVRWDAFGPNYSTVTFWHTKTNKPRTVPLTSRCRDLIKARKDNGGYGPFSGVNRHTMRDRWDSMRNALGYPDVTPHTLRHTCCTRLVLGGVDIKRVMEWMGHEAVQTTMRYMQMKPKGLEDVLHILERPQVAA